MKCLIFLVTLQIVLANAQVQTMTDALRRVALSAHNNYRSTVANGKAVNKDGSKLPKAGDIYMLTYSKMVEGYAQELAKSCVFKHNKVNGTSNNLYQFGSTAGYMDPATAIQKSVDGWYAELKNDGQKSLTMDGTNYNHFTQVVWAKTKEIGCAVANCPKMDGVQTIYKYTYVVCDYSPA